MNPILCGDASDASDALLDIGDAKGLRQFKATLTLSELHNPRNEKAIGNYLDFFVLNLPPLALPRFSFTIQKI